VDAPRLGQRNLVLCLSLGNIAGKGKADVRRAPLASAIAGEFVEASGRWVIDKQHGQQFRADSMRTTHPATPEGIEKYLGSGLIKGIGPIFAGKLVQAFAPMTRAGREPTEDAKRRIVADETGHRRAIHV